MKLNRFFCEEKIGNNKSIVITRDDLVNQLKNVFRLTKGDEVILFDNTGFDFLASIQEYEKDSVSFSIIKSYPNNVLPIRETYLFTSMVKKDNFEWIIEKATELGVSHIIP
ncbi:MAG: RsmE family RNA methyltransferase, partial [Candidatus Taylorbacteria bacterium]|nr:RsmE family RNA methyltransferase [Candidatus Taylorbacteria bacterium]